MTRLKNCYIKDKRKVTPVSPFYRTLLVSTPIPKKPQRFYIGNDFSNIRQHVKIKMPYIIPFLVSEPPK
ncbi:hypothetical protein HanXRQr2_Chr03g0114421 [Helianthus annuus]|uniref:Uncharacterized protein n=1 Tax=Helianthus annuus TaxID=4232 RepID=A0A9K3NX90_HELAN|nr:hypothetical protein HanXRQr2_Chr03g0114421 [Helianthus annuus]KAJ0943964.1 hypothetical protein HanPSC8_Chr03g0110761 [Helianthus annuus]